MQPRSDEALVDVVVADSVGPSLAHHMESTGRQAAHPLKLQQRVQMGVFKQWGTGAVKRFQDDDGGGWLVSVASFLDSEDLVAVIRTIHGTRMVCAVVESDEVEEFGRTGHWQTEAARGLDPELAAEIAKLEANPPAAPGRPGRPTAPTSDVPTTARLEPVPEPDDPRLIVWWEPVQAADGEGEPMQRLSESPKVKRTTFGAAQSEVLPLLMKGCRVEVWSDPKHPEIKVSL